MCTRPPEMNGHSFSCRSCNECLDTRRRQWIARCMAEKTDHPHTLWVDLTYSEDTQDSRDAARFFSYIDFKMFVDRLRSAARRYAKKHQLNIVPYVRFLVAGEQGDENGRCHWHAILFTNFDVLKIGEFKGLKNRQKVALTERSDLITVFRGEKKRLDWSLWAIKGHPIGFVCVHDVDEGGAAYVCSYINKDQFSAEKSEGTMRESKSENFATGLFRMSKRPGIGENFLMRKFEALETSGSVLPSLNIKIPGLKGYWHPSGLWRKKILWCLLALNTRARWATGCDAAQWSSLLRSCEDNQPDLDILHGKIDETENPEHSDYECPVNHARKEAAWRAAERPQAGTHDDRLCSCYACLDAATDALLEKWGVIRIVHRQKDGGGWSYWDSSTFPKQFPPDAGCIINVKPDPSAWL